MRKVIEETADYTIYQDEFEGKPILFRYWHNAPNGVDIKFTEAFAQANGYASKDEMIAQTIGEHGRQQMIAMCGYFPDWVRFNDTGEAYIIAGKPLAFRVMGEA